MLNYMKFINWFKKQLKKGGGGAGKHFRISDATLQDTMKIWREVDTDGMGVGKEGLEKVMNKLIHAGILKLDETGQIVQ